MARIRWRDDSNKIYEDGVSRGLLAPHGSTPVPWDGLISIEDTSTNQDLEPIYQSGVRVHNYALFREFEASVTAYTYPDELESILEQEFPPTFDLSYRTEQHPVGYKLHIVYNCSIVRSGVERETISLEYDPVNFNWIFTAYPKRDHDGVATASHFVIDSSRANPEGLLEIETILYGSTDEDPRVPTPFEIRYILGGMNPFEIVPDPEGGLSDLIPSGKRDLAGNVGIGLYRRVRGSRLNEREHGPGLNRLD